MAGSEFQKRPDEVWYVATIMPEEERKRYYGPRRPNRMYGKLAQVKQFLTSHPNRPHKVWRGTVTWEEVDVPD